MADRERMLGLQLLIDSLQGDFHALCWLKGIRQELAQNPPTWGLVLAAFKAGYGVGRGTSERKE